MLAAPLAVIVDRSIDPKTVVVKTNPPVSGGAQ
jgi:hypothetical protein